MKKPTWLFLVLVVSGNCLGQAGAPLIQNGGFTSEVKKPGAPDFWQTFAHEGNYTVAIDKTGRPCLKVEGTAEAAGGRAGAFQKTPVFDAAAGLRFSVWTKGEGGKRAVVFQFFDAQEPGRIADMTRASIPGQDADFREFSAEVAIPKPLRGRKIAVNFMLYLYGTGQCAWADARLEPLDKIQPRLEDAETDAALVRPNPSDGAVACQNPPDFRWRPEKWAHAYTLQLCQSRDFAGPTLMTFGGVRYNCFNLPYTLKTGEWFWRYSFVSEAGDKSGWSVARSFKLPEGAPTFVLPPIEEVKRRIGREHPRLYVRRGDLEAFRRRKEGEAKEWWATFEHSLERRLKAEPAAEPADADLTKLKKPIDLDYFKVDTKLRQAAGQVTDGLWNLAFAYLVTGDRQYADGAKKYLLHVSRWDPNGATSFASNDQVFRDIAIKSAMAYDWLHDALTDDERAVVQKAILERGRDLFKRYAGSDWRILNHPYDSHGQTNIGFLGLITLAVVGDVPGADEWLDYTVKVYSNSFPPWGDADGGWAQGVSYWKWSCWMSFQYVDALRTAAGIDLFQKPWFRENGWFKLHFQPPSCKFSHFGDTGPHGPDGSDRNNLAHYAAVHRNPYFQWYAASIPAGLDSSPYGYFFFDASLKAKPPVDVPQSRLSRDIGWVAMHSALWRPDNIMLFAKSSWYGSCSHSHADQNSFVLYGYGEPLAIDSGYYPWFGSDHHFKWAMQTKAHNSMLVDGEGQPIQDISAKGEVLDFLGGTAYTYWLGEAAGAYQGKLKKFQRHILHIRPDKFVIYDDLEAARPATFQWLLHSLRPMEIDAAAKSVLVKSGNARLWVKHLLPTDLTQTQTDSFSVPPEARGGEQPNQWHYTAATTAKSPSARFLTLLRVSESSQAPSAKAGTTPVFHVPQPPDEGIADFMKSAILLLPPHQGTLGLRAVEAKRTWLVAFGAGEPASETGAGEMSFDGKVAACEVDEGRPMRFLLVGGRRLRYGATTLVESSASLSLSAGWLNGVFSCQATLPRDVKMTLFLGQKPATVRLNGKPLAPSDWLYDADRKVMSLTLKAGAQSIEAFTVDPSTLRLAEQVELRMLDKIPPIEWGSALSANYTQALWGQFEATPSFCRAKLDGPGEVWLNGEKVIAGREALVQSRNQVLVEASVGAGIPKVTLEPLYSAGGAVGVVAVADDDPRLATALKIEAEIYAEGIRGTPQIYSHRTFLSGGKGVSTPPTMGVGARWKSAVPKAGRYQLVLKVATHEASAVRAIMVDGQPLLGDNPVVRFPSTGGFGGTPGEWKHYAVARADGPPLLLELAAGSHIVELVSVEGLLNLDYLLLLPLP